MLLFDVAPTSTAGSDLSQFLVTVWARHPDRIPNGVGGIVLGLVEPCINHTPLVFISSSELVCSKCDTLQFRVFIRVLEVHDYTILAKDLLLWRWHARSIGKPWFFSPPLAKDLSGRR
jgi:hypothetical protein